MFKRKWHSLLIDFENFLNKPRSKETIKKVVAIVISGILLIVTFILSNPYIGTIIEYEAGDIALDDIRVTKDIRYELPYETEKLKIEVSEKTRFVFDRDYQVLKKAINELSTEFENLIAISSNSDNSFQQAAENYPYLKKIQSLTPEEIYKALKDPGNKKNFIKWVTLYTTYLFDNFGITEDPVENLAALEKNGILVRTTGSSDDSKSELNWNSDKLIYNKALFSYYNYNRITESNPANEKYPLSEAGRKLAALRVVQYYYYHPFMRPNFNETENRKKIATENVKAVYAVLKKGLTIVRAGDPIDSEKLDKIKIINQFQGKTNFNYIFGIFIIQLILLGGVAYYIYRFSEFSMRDITSYVILTTLFLWIIFYSYMISRIVTFNNVLYFALLIPVSFNATMSCLLLGPRVAFATGTYLSFFIFLLSGNESESFLISFISVCVGIYATDKLEKRTQFLKAGLINGFVVIIAIFAIDLVKDNISPSTKFRLLAGFGNAFISIILVIGILPVYEILFNLPTKFRLMELTDYSHPLLKKLSEVASSSYTHSLTMATIAERAVGAIGGDTLLARVGCLYHDIGKMNNAEVYAENVHLKEGSEKTLGFTPEKYARIIIDHVKDGIEMGIEYRLPQKVIAFIPEHHGTATMQYFYHKALKEASHKNNAINKLHYCYPGPSPQSRETAVVMLVDSIEAASRSLDHPTREQLETLVDYVIESKTKEGQLDNCSLTLSDLKKIRNSFIDTIVSTHHIRPKYPTKESTKKLENNMNNRPKKVTAKTTIKITQKKKENA